jgi:hypothetical protein
MAKIVGRRPIELKLISNQDNYMPIFDGTTKLWTTIDKNSIISSSAILNNNNAFSGSQIISGSLSVIGPVSITGSFDASQSGITGSLLGTASNALTASYADNFTVAGTLTAQTIVAQTITSSIEFVTGSTRNGSLLSNIHEFTGSVDITGSLIINGNSYTADSASFLDKIDTNHLAFTNFSGSYVNESSSFTDKIRVNSSSFADFSGSYINESSSFASRITTNSASFATFSGSYTTESSSFASRITTNSSSFATFSGSYVTESSSFADRITTNSASISSLSSSFATFSGSFNTGSFTGSFTGSVIGTASYAAQALTASHANTASSADNFLVRGTLTAQTIVAQTITSSIEFITGSTRNGSLLSNTHQFTGSVGITGSLSINGIDYATTSGSVSTRLTDLEVFSGSYSTGSFTGSFIGRHTGSFSGSLYNLQNSVLGHIPFFSASQVLSDSIVRQLDNGSSSFSIVINQDNITTAAPEALYVWQPSDTSYNVVAGKGNLNNYLQLNIQNLNTGENASSDVVATANNGNESVNYINMGINSEGFTGSIGNENDAYLYSTGNHLHIGNTSPNQPLGLFVGGDEVEVNRKLVLRPNNQHEVTGSLNVSGSIVAHSFTGSLQGTASWASNAINATSASYAVTASSAINADNAQTASYVLNAVFSSFATSALTASNANTASYVETAQTASYVLNAVSSSYATNADSLDGKDSTIFATTGSNVFVGNQTITGSFAISGSTTQIGNNTLSGSITVTGSVNAKADINLGGILRLDPAIDPGSANPTASFLFTSASNTATGYDLYYRQGSNKVKFKWFEGVLNTGILYGGVLTYSSSYFYVSSGSGIIVNHNATTGSEISPTITYVNWAASSHSIATPTAQNTYVFIDANGDVQQQNSFFTPEQYHEALPIGRVSHYGAVGTTVTGVGNNMLTSYDLPQQLGQFTRAFGPLKISGFTITPQVGNLSLNIGSGTAFNLGGYYQNTPDLPSTYNSNTYLTSSIIRIHRSGSGFLFDNNGGSYYTSVDPTLYDDGDGTLATVGSGNWSIQRVFVNPITGRSHVYYGQSTYTTYLNAVQSVATDDFVESEVTKNAYVFAGYLVMKGGAANDDLSVGGTTNAIVQAGLFRNSVGGSGGATTAVSELNDISDVTITTPSNGQALIYSSGTWINGTPVSASHATTASFALTASYISGSGGGVGFPFSGSAVITGSLLISSSFVDFTKATYVTGSFTGSFSGNITSASHAIYAEYAGNSPGLTTTFTQSIAATTWSFTHNLNTRTPILQVYDSTNHQIVPLEIIGSDPNQATIYFDAPESGFAIATNGGTLTVSGSTARLDQTVAAVTWSFQHNLATKYPNFIVYDSTDNVVIPAGIHAVDDSAAEIYFAFPTTGVAIANFSGISGAPNTMSSSFATTASFASTASYWSGSIIHATSASFATTASYLLGQSPTSSYALTASFVTTAQTASYVLNAVSSSYAATSSYSNNFTVGNTLTIDQSLTDYHIVASSAAGENNMFNVVTGSYSAAFFKYTAANGSNARSGEVMAVWNNGAIQYTDNSTVDIGDTSEVISSVVIVSNVVQFNLTTATSGWKLKSLGTFM